MWMYNMPGFRVKCNQIKLMRRFMEIISQNCWNMNPTIILRLYTTKNYVYDRNERTFSSIWIYTYTYLCTLYVWYVWLYMFIMYMKNHAVPKIICFFFLLMMKMKTEYIKWIIMYNKVFYVYVYVVCVPYIPCNTNNTHIYIYYKRVWT